MIQITLGGPRIVKDDGYVAQQSEFAQRHCIVLKDFVDKSILRHVPRMLNNGEFYTREESFKHSGKVWARELKMRDHELLPRMFFLLLNQPRLFDAIADLTGSEKDISSFDGRCYKRTSGDKSFDTWHTDNIRNRLYGLSINLSTKSFNGGDFQIRNMETGDIFQTISKTRFGDAHLFRIHKSIEHKVFPVLGAEPRSVYAGWFIGGVDSLDYRDVVRKTLVRLAGNDS